MADTRDVLKESEEKTKNGEHTERLLAEAQGPVPRFGQFAMESGLTPKRVGNQLEFHLKAKGKDEVLFTVDNTPEGFEKATKLYGERVEKMMTAITKKYGVDFSREGEDAVRQVHETDDGKLEKGKMLKARSPSLPELVGIEAALEHSEPSHLSKDGKHGVKFYFLKEAYSQDKSQTDAIANYIDKDERGLPAVLMAPGNNPGRPVTEEDRPLLDEYSIESLLVHELAHNAQRHLEWDDESNEKFEKTSRQMGWAPYEIPVSHQGIWMFKLKDGDLYKLGSDGLAWVRADEKGNLLDKNGKQVDKEEAAASLAPSEVRERALIRPGTEYFDNWAEEDAEAKMLFRVSQTRRGQLLKDSPQLYDFEKEQDQFEIDQYRGKHADGASKFIRSLDGALVENTVANRKVIADFEKSNRP